MSILLNGLSKCDIRSVLVVCAVMFVSMSTSYLSAFQGHTSCCFEKFSKKQICFCKFQGQEVHVLHFHGQYGDAILGIVLSSFSLLLIHFPRHLYSSLSMTVLLFFVIWVEIPNLRVLFVEMTLLSPCPTLPHPGL